MRKFVQPNRIKKRPTKRVIIRTEAKNTASRRVFLYFYWKQIVGILAVGISWYFFFFFNRIPIQHVAFTQNTESQRGYKPIYETITTSLIHQWFVRQKRRRWSSWVVAIRKEFPIVKDITIASFENGTLTLDIQYSTPDFIMSTENKTEWVVYRNHLFSHTSWSLLGGTGIHINIALPEDMMHQLSGGIFLASSSQTIARTIKQIDFLTWLRVTYYPWWEKLAFVHGKDTFVISLEQEQLIKTLDQRKRILPYLPTALPTQVDLSNPDNTIITY